MQAAPAPTMIMAPVARTLDTLEVTINVPFTAHGDQNKGPAIMLTYGSGGGSGTGQNYIFCG